MVSPAFMGAGTASILALAGMSVSGFVEWVAADVAEYRVAECDVRHCFDEASHVHLGRSCEGPTWCSSPKSTDRMVN